MYQADDKDAEFTHTTEKLNLQEVGPQFFFIHSPLPALPPSLPVSFVPPLKTTGEDVKNLIKK